MTGQSRLATGVAAAVMVSTEQVAGAPQAFDVDLTTEIGDLITREFGLRGRSGNAVDAACVTPASVSMVSLFAQSASATSAADPTRPNQNNELRAKLDDGVTAGEVDIADPRMEEQPRDRKPLRPGRQGRAEDGDPAG